MSSKQTQPISQYTSVSRPHQGRTSQAYAYQQAGASNTLNSWLSEADSKAPFHAIGGYRPMTAVSDNGTNTWGSGPAPSSTGATWGSVHGDRS
ncbi:uncharacterized protein ColSpa_00703 [Colletotrichum spaethianum]|uniref:Uncharacterized protein n=1 Tax=Colletotrichum spaethianum TaxID=700344 RepID=A0AA37NT73_9PEZI|nr:uncharacterized protein ColSpa_00703 [Colletotrichum spaethianum]GKT40522.1 hypothetical protein ColSpa_00703 [Colletotrichum spaethianum]